MKKNIVYAFMVALALLLSACGSNDKSDRSLKDLENAKIFTAEAGSLTIRNNLGFSTSIPFTKLEGSDLAVELSNFDLKLTGCELDGPVTYSPSPLTLDGGKNSQKSITVSGKVKNDCNATGYKLSADKKITLEGQSKTTTGEDILDVTLDANGNPIGSGNPTNPNKPVLDGNFSFYNYTSSIAIDTANKKYTDEFKIQLLDSVGKPASGKTVEILPYTKAYGKVALSAITDSDGFANFVYTSPENLAPIAGDILTLTFVYDDNGTRYDSQNITLSFSASTTTPNSYNFMNATSITVKSASEEKEITVDLVDGSGVGISGKEVKVTNLAIAFGSLSPATAKTDGAGRATFTYKAPLDLSSVNGQSQDVSLLFTDEDDNTITATATITIQSATVGGATYSLVNETTPVTITHANQVEIISVNVVNALNVGVVGKNVTLSTPTFGALTSAIVTTDAAGLAEFTYRAPSNISGLVTTAMTLSFTEDGVTVSKNVTVNVNTTTATSDYILINTNDVTVNFATQSAEIAVQVTKNGTPVAGESVTAKSIPAAFGRIENATVVSGADGYARFNYIAADPLTDGVQPLELIHTDTNGAEATVTVNITVLAKALYAFTNESNLTVAHPNDQIDIKAQLLLKGVPVAGKTVQMEGFDAKYGSIFNYTVITDSGGYATFAYTAPNTQIFDDVNGTTQTFTVKFIENGKIIEETNTTINFNRQNAPIIVIDRPIVILPQGVAFHPLIIDENSKNVDIDIRVFKNGAPYTSGVVKVSLPDEAITGTDVGLFDEYNVSIDSRGIAKFKYNGPSNLLQTLSSTSIDDNNSIFTFYHVENNATNGDELTIEFRIPKETLQNRNYTLDVITSGEYSMGIPDRTKTFNVVLKAQDASGNAVELSNESITKITITSENAPIAQILDGNTSVSTLELVSNTFTMKSKTLSGLVPIKVKMEFIDADSKPQVIETIINVRVYSGPASAISISYVSTGQDKGRAKYEETLAISVTDEYGNKVNTRPNITLGAVVGYAVGGSEVSNSETNTTKRLFYGRDDIDNGIANGEIKELGDNNVATTEFEDNTVARTDVFKYVNAEGNNTDKLIVFGERKNYEAMGKWDIVKGGDNHTLALKDNYLGVDRSGLYYAVGHNYYQDQCRQDGREWIGTTDSETYKLDEEGTVTVTYKYDYHLAGKDALIWVNLDGIQPDTGVKTRVGEATKATLRSAGLVAAPSAGYTLPKGTRALVEFDIWHENAPERYRNAKFGYRIAAGSNCSILKRTTSNIFDARTCNNRQTLTYDNDNNVSTPENDVGTLGNGYGGAYAGFYLEAPIDKDCTFSITNITVGNEF